MTQASQALKTRTNKPFVPREGVGVIGSYSSFFGLLLIATVLVYREIFYNVFDLVQKGLPSELVNLTFIATIVIFAVVFVAIPFVPTIKEIAAAFKDGNRRMAWMLVFIICIYGFALLFQLVYAYLERFSSILT